MPKLTVKNRKWWILVTMTGTFSMVLIDSTVVSVALPTIQKDLDLGSAELQWIVNAYLLGLACLVAVGGRLADMFGQSRMFKIGIVIFVVASALSGLAQSGEWIISARAVQGVGAALMIPPTMAIVINAFPVKERGTAMGIYAGISMVFLALGPMVGGLFTEYWSWRMVFYINLPIGIAVIVLSLLTVPKDRPTSKPVLDYPGLVTLVVGLVAFVLALMQSSVWGWESALTLGLLIGGALMIVLFVLIEPKMKNALVELRLFHSRNFSGNAAVLFLVQFILMGLTVFGSIWVQKRVGLQPGRCRCFASAHDTDPGARCTTGWSHLRPHRAASTRSHRRCSHRCRVYLGGCGTGKAGVCLADSRISRTGNRNRPGHDPIEY